MAVTRETYTRYRNKINQQIGVGTRFNSLSENDLDRHAAWVEAATKVVPLEYVFVAVHSESDLSRRWSEWRKSLTRRT